MSEVLDLGSGVSLRFLPWAPDRALNSQYDGIPDVERYSAIIRHPLASAESGICEGAITLDGEVASKLEQPLHPRWKVESWDPLTLSPSILCGCGFHGYVRNGRWVPA